MELDSLYLLGRILDMALMTDRTHVNEYDRPFRPEVYEKPYFEGAQGSAYESYFNTAGILTDLMQMVVRSLEPRFSIRGNRVLDIGGAYGHVSKASMIFGASAAWNVELSPWAASKAKVLYPKVTTVEGDVLDPTTWEQLPFGFALVTAFEFFEHIPTDSVGFVLHKMRERADWGAFLIQSRSWIGLPEDMVSGDHGHLHFHSNLWWLNKLDEFADIDFDTMLPLNQAASEIPNVQWANRLYVVKFRE